MIVASAKRLKAESVLLDGEGTVPGADGVSDFEALRSRSREGEAILYAFDVLELDGADLRPQPDVEIDQDHSVSPKFGQGLAHALGAAGNRALARLRGRARCDHIADPAVLSLSL